MRKTVFATLVLCATSTLLPPALAAQPAPGDNWGYNNSYQVMPNPRLQPAWPQAGGIAGVFFVQHVEWRR